MSMVKVLIRRDSQCLWKHRLFTCRAFLSMWKDESDKYVIDGRGNMGVVSLNLVQPSLITRNIKDESERIEEYFRLLDIRLDIAYRALMKKYELLKDTHSDVAPILWQDGGLARLKKGEPITELLSNGYMTISLGYVGIYEAVLGLIGESHTTEKGQKLALRIMDILNSHIDKWKKETGLGFALYGTPAESLISRFCKLDKDQFGEIKDITDKGYYTNSFHVFVGEEINVFDKFSFESQFQSKSLGGCISYAEIPNMSNNIEALLEMVKYIYDHIQYAEFNTKSDYCHKCGFDQEIKLNDNNEWECPQCGNKDESHLSIVRRTCGYLGANLWNEGKTKEIKNRVLHI